MLFKKIDSDSANYVTTALDFFETPATETSVSSSFYRVINIKQLLILHLSFQEYLTLNPLNSKPFNFKLFPLTSFIDLSKIYLFAELKIFRKDGNNKVALDADDNVASIQMPGLTFIKNLTVMINQREVYDSRYRFFNM